MVLQCLDRDSMISPLHSSCRGGREGGPRFSPPTCCRTLLLLKFHFSPGSFWARRHGGGELEAMRASRTGAAQHSMEGVWLLPPHTTALIRRASLQCVI